MFGKHAGEKGLFALAPPHQGIDGEWSDGSGVIVYKWNERETGRTQAGPTGRRGGAVVLNMMRRHCLVGEDGMSLMMMASHFSSSPLI